MCDAETEIDDYEAVAVMVANALALIDRGVDINATDSIGWTPLHYACLNGLEEVTMALLEKGAYVQFMAGQGHKWMDAPPLRLYLESCRGGHGAADEGRGRAGQDQ
jgi:hypothetical protein